MITPLDEALAAVRARALPLAAEDISLTESYGRVLAEGGSAHPRGRRGADSGGGGAPGRACPGSRRSRARGRLRRRLAPRLPAAARRGALHGQRAGAARRRTRAGPDRRDQQRDALGARSEERRVGKSVDLGGRRIIKKKKKKEEESSTEYKV